MTPMRLAALAFVVLSLTACRDTWPATPPQPKPIADQAHLDPAVDPTGEALQPGTAVKEVDNQWLLLAYQADQKPHEVVDYILFRNQEKTPAVHVECTKPEHGFPVFLRRDALDPGHYTLKTYMDKEPTPFAVTTLQVP
jgi:hypothetical protein